MTLDTKIKQRRSLPPEPLPDSVVVQIRNSIMRGDFAPGFHLQEFPIAKQLGVSRTPVREALIILAQEGLLEPGPKRGYKIRTFSIDDVLEAYDIRATLEGTACRLLAEAGISDDSKKILAKCVDAGEALLSCATFDQAVQNEWIEMNHTFHSTLIHAAGNALLVNLIEQVHQIPLVGDRNITLYKEGDDNNYEARGAQTFHESILEAIQSRQGARAENLMREHIYTARKLIIRQFGHAKQIGFDSVPTISP